MGENFCILHFKSFQEKLIPIPNICHLVFCFLEWTIDPSTSASLKLNDVLLLFITAVVCYQKKKNNNTWNPFHLFFNRENSLVKLECSNKSFKWYFYFPCKNDIVNAYITTIKNVLVKSSCIQRIDSMSHSMFLFSVLNY
jgi:hypothetical protein